MQSFHLLCGTVPALSASQQLAGEPWGRQSQLTLCCPHRHPFTPPKLSTFIDEAKTYAAEYTLQTLGIPLEGAEVPPAAPAFPGMGISVLKRLLECHFSCWPLVGVKNEAGFWPLRTQRFVLCVWHLYQRIPDWFGLEKTLKIT